MNVNDVDEVGNVLSQSLDAKQRLWGRSKIECSELGSERRPKAGVDSLCP